MGNVFMKTKNTKSGGSINKRFAATPTTTRPVTILHWPKDAGKQQDEQNDQNKDNQDKKDQENEDKDKTKTRTTKEGTTRRRTKENRKKTKTRTKVTKGKTEKISLKKIRKAMGMRRKNKRKSQMKEINPKTKNNSLDLINFPNSRFKIC